MYRTYLVSLVCLLVSLSTNADAMTLKLATLAPDGTSWMREVRKGADEIAQRTDGRVKFRFYPGGVMGNDTSVLRKIRIGQLHGGSLIGLGMAAIYPDTHVYGLPFIFRSYDEVDYVRRQMDRQILEGFKERGFISLGLAEAGFAYIMCSQPIRTAADLKARKVWIPEGDRISLAALQAIDVAPIPLPLTDVLTGLQTGLIDTVGGSPAGAVALQWHTQVKYLTDAPFYYLYGTVVIQRKAFEKLSPQDQALVKEIFGGVLTRLNRQVRKDNEKARQALQRQGIAVIPVTEAEKQRWHDIMAAPIERLGDQGVYSPAMLKILRRHLANYRR